MGERFGHRRGQRSGRRNVHHVGGEVEQGGEDRCAVSLERSPDGDPGGVLRRLASIQRPRAQHGHAVTARREPRGELVHPGGRGIERRCFEPGREHQQLQAARSSSSQPVELFTRQVERQVGLRRRRLHRVIAVVCAHLAGALPAIAQVEVERREIPPGGPVPGVDPQRVAEQAHGILDGPVLEACGCGEVEHARVVRRQRHAAERIRQSLARVAVLQRGVRRARQEARALGVWREVQAGNEPAQLLACAPQAQGHESVEPSAAPGGDTIPQPFERRQDLFQRGLRGVRHDGLALPRRRRAAVAGATASRVRRMYRLAFRHAEGRRGAREPAGFVRGRSIEARDPARPRAAGVRARRGDFPARAFDRAKRAPLLSCAA